MTRSRLILFALSIVVAAQLALAQGAKQEDRLLILVQGLRAAQPAVLNSETGLKPVDSPLLERAEELWREHSFELVYPGANVHLSSEEREEIWRLVRDRPEFLKEFGLFLPQRAEVQDWVCSRYANEGWLPIWHLTEERHREELIRRANEGNSYFLTVLAVLDRKRAESIARRLQKPLPEFCSLLRFLHNPASEPWSRDKLLARVQDSGVSRYERSLAAGYLLRLQWDGRDEFLMSLLEDPAMPAWVLQEFVLANPDWIPRMVSLVNGPRGAVRNNAIVSLLAFTGEKSREDALRPLLPWLKDPGWADLKRLPLIESLARVKMAEATPGLVRVLRKSGTEAEVVAAVRALEGVPDFPELIEAALPRVTGSRVSRAMTEMALRHGLYTLQEQVESVALMAAEFHRTKPIEAHDKLSPEERFVIFETWGRLSYHSLSSLSQQQCLAAASLPSASPELRVELCRLARDWRLGGNPALETLELILFQLKGEEIDRHLLSRLGDSDISLNFLTRLLVRREALSVTCPDLLRTYIAGGGAKAGVSAVLLGDRSLLNSMLSEGSLAERLALLISARYIGFPLDLELLEKVALDADVRITVLDYLRVCEQEGASRSLSRLLGGYQVSGRVLNQRWGNDAEAGLIEKYLRRGKSGELFVLELKSDTQYVIDAPRVEVWLDGQRGELFIPGGESYEHRILTKHEVQALRSFGGERSLGSWPRWNNFGSRTHWPKFQFLHLAPGGGRRFPIRLYWGRDQGSGQKYVDLITLFKNIAEVPSQTIFPSFSQVPGARVIEDHSDASVFWADEEGLKVYCGENDVSWKPYWRFFTPEGLRGRARPPKELLTRDERGGWLLPDGSVFDRSLGQDPVVGGNGWVLFSERAQKGFGCEDSLKLLRLEDRSVHPVDIPPADGLWGMAYLPSHQSFLARRSLAGKPSPNNFHHYLVNPESGHARQVKGEFRPWLRGFRKFGDRPLQSAGGDHYWCALATETGTEVGLIDEKTFSFEARAHYPGLSFESHQMWVLGEELYVASKDILRLPLARAAIPHKR